MKYLSKRHGKYRSGAEKEVGDHLALLGISALYEAAKLTYTQSRRYTPDFTINGNHIEVKGWWPPADRAKLLAVIRQNPSARILVALENPNMTISRKSKTSYAQWCYKNGIRWSPIPIPPDLLAQWLGASLTSPVQAQTAKAATGPQHTQMDLSTALFANADTTEMDRPGSGP